MRYQWRPTPQTADDRNTICTDIATLAREMQDDAKGLRTALETTLAELNQIASQLNQLPEGLCTGTQYIRHSKGNCLYINHGVDESCPIHGEPKPGKRLRVYIGINPEKQAAAIALTDPQGTLKKLRQRFDTLAKRIEDASYSIEAAFSNLMFHSPGRDRPAIPKTNY